MPSNGYHKCPLSAEVIEFVEELIWQHIFTLSVYSVYRHRKLLILSVCTASCDDPENHSCGRAASRPSRR